MRRSLRLFCLGFLAGVLIGNATQTNVLLICVDDLRPELNCYGRSYIHSPNIDRLASEGHLFVNHYVNAPSCGPSRYTLLTGRYGVAKNSALFERARRIEDGLDSVYPSLPEIFRSNGYTTVSVGKVSHHPGGRGGPDWDSAEPIEMPGAWDRHLMPSGEWQHPRGAMHGLAFGEIRENASEMAVFQAVDGSDTIYPDGLITEEALRQLDLLIADKTSPFFLAVGMIRPHLPFGAPQEYLDLYADVSMPEVSHPKRPKGKTTWHKSGEFYKYHRWDKDPNKDEAFSEEVRRHYAACVSYADAQIGKILDRLEATGEDENTIVIVWGDHGWHLGEHAIWGKHSLFEESLHSPLIVKYPGMDRVGGRTDAIVSTVDIFPTLLDLVGLTLPDFLQGDSLVPHLENGSDKEGSAFGYSRWAETIRTRTHRLTVHDSGFVELYDHTSPERETKNVSKDFPEVVSQLKELLAERSETVER
ncbi:MAG: sulfatase [Verrucomicrobiota bacterium]